MQLSDLLNSLYIYLYHNVSHTYACACTCVCVCVCVDWGLNRSMDEPQEATNGPGEFTYMIVGVPANIQHSMGYIYLLVMKDIEMNKICIIFPFFWLSTNLSMELICNALIAQK